MTILHWQPERDSREQLVELVTMAGEPGILAVTFPRCQDGEPLRWSLLEPWTRSRSVTVADVAGDLAGSALDAALCCDLVYLRQGIALRLPAPEEAPSAGLLWALARAGRPALARGLLGSPSFTADEAVAVGLAQAVVDREESLPLPQPCSLAALTAVRDLMRARSPSGPALQLELATFQLLFATAQPQEGAEAFLDNREPRFDP